MNETTKQPESVERSAGAPFAARNGSTALANVLYERKLQDQKWGIQNHDPLKWLAISGEEHGEACRAVLEGLAATDTADQAQWLWKYRDEMVQVAAVAIAAIESFDRRYASVPSNDEVRDRAGDGGRS